MKNLKLVQHLEFQHSQLSNINFATIDIDTGVIYCIDNTGIFGLDLNTQQIVNEVSLVAEGFLDFNANNIPIGITYLSEQQVICVATSHGDVIIYNPVTQQVECVGSVESGLTAICWSPDQEIIVLTTGENTVILMTKDFEGIAETPLHPEDFGENKSITVGWGKKETQFHGSIGKQAAVSTIHQSIGPVFAWDDKSPRISWREDGHYFVISAVNPENGTRRLRVWNRECILQSTSEPVNGIEQAVCWRPSGNLIASSQHTVNKHEVIFFELNGLRHGELKLPFQPKQVKIREIFWNNDSTILSLWCENMIDQASTNLKENNQTSFQLWTMGNYHWYLKYNLCFHSSRIKTVVWDPEHVFKLHIICDNGKYLQYTWSRVVNSSRGQNKEDMASVAVIDGSHVLVTPFRHLVIPPPMSAYQILLPNSVNHVIYAPPPQTNDVSFFLDNGKMILYRAANISTDDESQESDLSIKLDGSGGLEFKPQVNTPKYKQDLNILSPEHLSHWDISNLHHFLWILPQVMLCIRSVSDASELIRLDIKGIEENKDKGVINLSVVKKLENFVLGMCCSSFNPTFVVIQFINGMVLRYEPASEEIMPWFDLSGREVHFPQPCLEMAVCHTDGEDILLGLTERFRFYVNNTEVSNNCTSFRVHDEYILLTTHSHTLRCIRIDSCKSDHLQDNRSDDFDENIRRVERGSHLVIAVPQDTKVILQMPRGNLETIHPRALALSVVCHHIDNLNYKEAFTIMRKHRINLNLLYDHNPKMFFENIETFIEQLENWNNISLFLTDLQEEDVTCTMYKKAYKKGENEKQTSKVDIICDSMKAAMEKMNLNKYLLAILTTHARKSHPELDLALIKIQSLRASGDYKMADEGLRHLLYLVDINDLYNVALGTYDFDLVIMVAEKSQKDPKEYLPFLNKLKTLEENYQRYTIDLHLKRYDKCLQHISKCDDKFEECMHLIKTHRLYIDALKLFPIDSMPYKNVSLAYGNYLSEQKQYEEAAVVFYTVKDFEKALVAFEKCRNWKQAMCMASLLNHSPNQIVQLAQSLANNLKNHHQHTDAAILLEQYAQDIEESIITLIEGYEWDEALRMVYKYKRHDITETHLKAAILEQSDYFINQLDKMKNAYEHHKERLKIVRRLKQQEIYNEDDHFPEKDCDLYSDVSSVTGTRSLYSISTSKISGRSSKNRRKAERKKHSLKEGSPFEDVALIEALAEIIKQLDKLKDQVASLLRILVMFEKNEYAANIQRKMQSFLTFVEESQSEIWTEDNAVAKTAQTFGPEFTSNMIASSIQQMEQNSSPKWKNPTLHYPPEMRKNFIWSLDILN